MFFMRAVANFSNSSDFPNELNNPGIIINNICLAMHACSYFPGNEVLSNEIIIVLASCSTILLMVGVGLIVSFGCIAKRIRRKLKSRILKKSPTQNSFQM